MTESRTFNFKEAGLRISHAAETNFIIECFRQLPYDEQGQIYSALQDEPGTRPRLKAVAKLQSLIEKDLERLTRYIGKELGGDETLFTTNYSPTMNTPGGAARFLDSFFVEHLHPDESGGYSIAQIKLPPP